jgi:transcriptional regulator with XRE-family HTH domain
MTQATLGTKVRRLRGELLLTQEELADAAGVTVETVNRIENGHHQPRARTMARLARALGVPASTLEQLRETS